MVCFLLVPFVFLLLCCGVMKEQYMSCNNITYLPYGLALDFKTLFSLNYNITTSKCENAIPVSFPSFFDTVVPLKGQYRDYGNRRMYAYFLFSSSRHIMVVAFGGTMFLDEWIDDVDYFQVEPNKHQLNNLVSGTRVHDGFLDVYLQVRNELTRLVQHHYKTPKTVYHITGYSLGGGLATICALDHAAYSPIVHTFASPRVFNRVGANKLNSLVGDGFYRIFNTEDVVPTLPPPIVVDLYNWDEYYYYEHCGKNVPFTSNLGTVLDNHGQAYASEYH